MADGGSDEPGEVDSVDLRISEAHSAQGLGRSGYQLAATLGRSENLDGC